MTDPISAGGKSAIRYALSTGPALVLMPIGLCIPVGALLGSVENGMKAGFYACVLFPLAVEYLRRGTLWFKSSAIRQTLLRVLTAVYMTTLVFSGLGLVLGFVAVQRCAVVACPGDDNVSDVIGLVFASFAVLASVVLVTFLRSPVWARHREASAAGRG